MKLYFIRHGQTDWNLHGRIQGSNDIELNETGLRQAAELARRLKHERFAEGKPPIRRVYSSVKKRAARTAEIICTEIGAELALRDGLEEINLGRWEGLTWDQVEEAYPVEYEEWYNHRGPARAPEGESYHDVVDRALKVVRRIIAENREDVAIVSHGVVITGLQLHLHGAPYSEFERFLPGNTGLVELDGELFLRDAAGC